MNRWAALAMLGLALGAAAAELDLSIPKERGTPRCESVVVTRCPQTAGAAAAAPAEGFRALEQRRAAPNLDQILEAVVIEGERQRRKPSLRELLDSRAPPPPGVSYEQWKRDDGSICTCSSPCLLPIILPCCVCSQGGSSSRFNGTVN